MKKNHLIKYLLISPSLPVGGFCYSEGLESYLSIKNLQESENIKELIKNELEASISSLNTAKKINPNDEQLKRMLGNAHYKFANSLLLKNDINRAISSYKNALSSNPNQLSAANRLAITLATTNDTKYQKPKEALAVAARLCQITKNQNPDFLDTLSIAYAANNNYQSAKQASLKAIELWGENNNEKRINAALNRIKGFERQISEKQQK